MRIREPRTTAMVFSTGKMVIMGAKSERESQLAAKMFEKAIAKVMI